MKIKVFNKKTIVSICLFISLVFLSNVAFADGYTIDDYKVNSTIKLDGNMHVEEYIKYNFEEDMNGLYRDILYKYNFNNQKNDMKATSSRYQAEDVTNIKVYTSNNSFQNMEESILSNATNLKNGMNSVYSLENKISNGYRKYLKVYSPVKEDTSKYVKYVYDIIDPTVKYNDAGELYWNFLGGDWECSINKFSVNINFENQSDLSKVKVYTHSYSNLSDVTLNNGIINFTTTGVFFNKAIDARIVFPVEYISYSNIDINEDYNYNTLNLIENQMNLDKKNYKLSNKIYLNIGLIGIIIFIYLTLKCIKNAIENLPKNKDIDYYREFPDNLSIGEYSALLGNKDYSYLNSNLLLSTILDLSNKKYIKMECLKKANKGLFDNIEYDYNLTIDVKKDISKLTDYEKIVISLLFDKKAEVINSLDGLEKTEIELNKAFKDLSEKYTVSSKFQKKCLEYSKEAKEKLYTKSSGGLHKKIFAFMGLIFLALILTVSLVSPLNFDSKLVILIVSFIFCTVATLILQIICYTCSFILKDEYIMDYKLLMGLKRYLNEYSLIKERYPIEIILWDRYLVFATLFGIAEKVSKEFKEELIAKGYDSDYIYMTYPLINMSMHSALITTNASMSTGSSSSGGYSGGGSGGGGGGGRWRRSILIIKLEKSDRNFYHFLYI